MLPICCPSAAAGHPVMQDAARTPSIPNLKRKIAVAAASDRSSAERRCEHRQASAGLPYQSVETICRMKSESMMMTCCAPGDQDAILGHVASRGDRTSPSSKIELRITELSSGTRQEFTPERHDISLVPSRPATPIRAVQ